MGGDAADDGSARYELGVSLWEKGEDRARAAAEFVAAAKSNPENAAAFRYLGEFYSGEEGRDPAKAAKCYGRAVGLDPLDWRSGEALCDLLEGEGKDSVAEAVCRRACEKSAGKAAWALRREGFLMVGRGEWLAAVPRLQQAIRARPACPLLWEALALSYQRLSRFSAALKSYAKALELHPQALFPAVQTGNLYLSLGVYDKAVEAFRGASGRCVAASYGLGSALLAHANHCVSLGAFRWAAQLLEEAAGVARAAAGRASNSSSLWKLLADIHLAYAKCYPWSQPLEVSEEAFEKSVESWRQTCTSAAISARRCYQRALILSPTQPNLYADIAIASHLINSSVQCHQASWNLPEKMALGSLLLEPQNHDLWVVLGYLSHRPALKQHALLRGLHLDVSLAVAWAYLGKVYRKENEKQLARQAFDCSRSIDPSLALPWAGMSASFQPGQPGADEAFESCLRAVQTLPLSEFQIGLAKLAAASGHLSSPQVFGAIEQAVQRSPHFPEVHNLKGLVFEARFDYHSAANSYRLARCALTAFPSSLSKCLIQDISVNLARSLSKAGNDVDTAHECENLKAEGLLDAEGLQIYALSLWRLGQSNLALSVAKNLATSVPSMERTLAAASISLICRLLYCISGLDSAIRSISKMPKELFQSCRVSFIVSAIHALDHSNSLVSVVSSSRNHVKSHEDTTKMHFLIALSKLIKSGTKSRLGYLSGVAHVRKALHMYPNSNLLRNLMGYLLIWGGGWNGVHSATRFCSGDGPMRGLKSSDEVAGVLGVACYALCTPTPRLSFPTCSYHCPTEPPLIQRLQKWLRREPWNQSVRYLLILNLAQKAREERFPRHLCVTLERLIHVALSSKCYSGSDTSSCYQKFSLLLCASETSLRGGNRDRCVQYAKKAALISLPDSHLFFAHLLLCRAYASCGDFLNLEKEYKRCLELKTDCDIGLVCLKLVEYQCGVQNGSEFELTDIWMAISNLVEGLALLRKQEFVAAEEVLRRGCALAGGESCLELCHGVSCLEAVKQQWSSELLPVAIRSLKRAEKGSPTPLPFVSALLGQAQGGLGSKDKWENKLRLEWNAWPPEMRPAELFFQMHLLAKQERRSDSSNIEHCQTPQKWVLRAIHTNPSCTRYWKVLHQLDTLNHSLPLL